MMLMRSPSTATPIAWLQWMTCGLNRRCADSASMTRATTASATALANCQHTEFCSYESIRRTGGMLSGIAISEDGDQEGGDMGAHMPAVGQQCHGTEDDTGDDLDDHHGGHKEQNLQVHHSPCSWRAEKSCSCCQPLILWLCIVIRLPVAHRVIKSPHSTGKHRIIYISRGRELRQRQRPASDRISCQSPARYAVPESGLPGGGPGPARGLTGNQGDGEFGTSTAGSSRR